MPSNGSAGQSTTTAHPATGAVPDPSPPTLVVQQPQVLVRRLDPALDPPAYEHPGDAGADLRCARETVIPAGGRATVPTGIALALPSGHVGFVTPRSGLAARHGITVLNAPGTVDAGYRGELLVTLLNTDPTQDFTVRHGDRIAQLVIQQVATVTFTTTDELPKSVRGTGGFGSTGGFLPPGGALDPPADGPHEISSRTETL
ncbi:MAG: dUTP diphosphatase [Actinomycetales bacterium]